MQAGGLRIMFCKNAHFQVYKAEIPVLKKNCDKGGGGLRNEMSMHDCHTANSIPEYELW